MQAVIGLLLLFTGAELVYLVVTGKLGAASSNQGTGSGPGEAAAAPTHVQRAAISATHWGTIGVQGNGGLVA